MIVQKTLFRKMQTLMYYFTEILILIFNTKNNIQILAIDKKRLVLLLETLDSDDCSELSVFSNVAIIFNYNFTSMFY